jgi:hypothetical protein
MGILTTAGEGKKIKSDDGFGFGTLSQGPHPGRITVRLDRPPMNIRIRRPLLFDTLGSFELHAPPL